MGAFLNVGLKNRVNIASIERGLLVMGFVEDVIRGLMKRIKRGDVKGWGHSDAKIHTGRSRSINPHRQSGLTTNTNSPVLAPMVIRNSYG